MYDVWNETFCVMKKYEYICGMNSSYGPFCR
jgi:hypothetical protein